MLFTSLSFVGFAGLHVVRSQNERSRGCWNSEINRLGNDIF
jgi:hypothetical protein